MNSCKYCRWYDQEFDESQAQMNDIKNGDYEEYHYCPMFMYPEHIKPDIYENRSDCSKFFKAP